MRCRQFGLVFVALLATVIGTGRIASAEVMADLEIVVTGGPFDGELGTGSFTYEPAAVDPVDLVAFPANGLTVEFTLFGQTFTQENDVSYSPGQPVEFQEYPRLTVYDDVDRTPRSFDFWISEVGSFDNLTDIVEPDVFGIYLFEDVLLVYQGEQGGRPVYRAEVALDAVPEPSTIAMWSLVGLIGIGCWTRKRRKAA